MTLTINVDDYTKAELDAMLSERAGREVILEAFEVETHMLERVIALRTSYKDDLFEDHDNMLTDLRAEIQSRFIRVLRLGACYLELPLEAM